MNPDLQLLAQLDELDRKLSSCAADITKRREAQAALESGHTQACTALAAAKAEVERVKAEERATQRKLDDLAKSRASALKVLESGLGSTSAAERQLERCDQLIDETESAMLELLEAQDRAASALVRATGAEAEAQRALSQGQAEIPRAIEQLEAQSALARAEHTKLHGQLATDLRSRYDGFRSRGRYAVARIHSGGCDACSYTVQPQMIADLQRGRMVTCQGCHRWLIPGR